MLTYYLTQTQRLLQNPGAPTTLYSLTDLTSWINTARGQVAGEGRCIRRLGNLIIVGGTQVYPFSAITGLGSDTQGVINVRNVFSSNGYLTPLSFEWITIYSLSTGLTGPVTGWAQFGQGSASTGSITGEGSGSIVSGSLYTYPMPSAGLTVSCDCVCYPIALVADTDVEAIPYQWTDAVPYFAAYLALMSAQTSSRLQQAQEIFQLYEQFMMRARTFANSDILAAQNPQSSPPATVPYMMPDSAKATAGQ